MTTINAYPSATRLLDEKAIKPGFCLQAVGNAILDGKPVLDHAATALDAWRDAGAARRHSGIGARGLPVFFSGAGGDGDVCISLGDGKRVAAIDYPRRGVTGIQTIASREHQVGGKLLGYSTLFLGYELKSVAPPAPAKPSNPSKAHIELAAAYLAKNRYGTSAARTTGIRGPVYWRAVQLWGRAHGLYGAGYIINGIPGTQTRHVEAVLIQDLVK